MDVVEDRRPATNPERVAARATLRALQAELVDTDRAAGAAFASSGHGATKLALRVEVGTVM